MMFGQIIAAQFGEANNWPLGAALTLIMMIAVTAIACAFIWFSRWGTVRRREMDIVIAAKEPTSTEGHRFDPLSSMWFFT
ncbi:MAG: hypothetical protein ACC641_09240 [Acidiferrobacterales bacterium]